MGVRQPHNDLRQTSNSQRPQPDPSFCSESVGDRHGFAGRVQTSSKRSHPTGSLDAEGTIDGARRSAPWQRSLSFSTESVKGRPWHLLASSLQQPPLPPPPPGSTLVLQQGSVETPIGSFWGYCRCFRCCCGKCDEMLSLLESSGISSSRCPG
ncbi:hypothetical protein LY76DRAFT_388229 [Colletotrichum caudatum]|nr:hypothetical protein LY76DRAFT_388229 [Colletotrichum caudatum]